VSSNRDPRIPLAAAAASVIALLLASGAAQSSPAPPWSALGGRWTLDADGRRAREAAGLEAGPDALLVTADPPLLVVRQGEGRERVLWVDGPPAASQAGDGGTVSVSRSGGGIVVETVEAGAVLRREGLRIAEDGSGRLVRTVGAGPGGRGVVRLTYARAGGPPRATVPPSLPVSAGLVAVFLVLGVERALAGAPPQRKAAPADVVARLA
jgi:hypothetical protein